MAAPRIRTIVKSYLAREQGEGVGARVRRTIGTVGLRNVDPFLMLDEFRVAPPAGFSDHPHRGFETVTLITKGTTEHEDFAGHRGKIGVGDLQWMTAGRGIVHAEVPVDECEGLQLWVNLPRKDKLMEPRYQELRGSELPKVQPAPGVDLTLIAGQAFGASAKVHTITPISYMDVTMEPNVKVNLPLPGSFNAFFYILRGSGEFSGKKGSQHEALVVDEGKPNVGKAEETEVPVQAGAEGARFVFLGGEPIGEPIAQRGPFVMTNEEEIRQAMDDFYGGKNGFERAPEFKSKLAERVARF